MIVSIDIGTSYSSICMLDPDGKVQPVDISTGASMYGGKYSLPTAVFVEDNGNILIGQAAMTRRKSNPRNFCMEFKRNFGEEAPILLSSRSFKPEELYTELFRHMKACAERTYGEPIESAYLTCPASYGEARKEKLRSAARAAGLFQVELVDEPTAAAMCYCAAGYIQDGQILLVYDFGGGTFDVSLLEYRNGAFRLLSEPEGLEQCGGADMDHLILEDMLQAVGQEILEELKQSQRHYLLFTSQLAEMAVRAKHHLSAADVFEEDIVIGFDMVPYRLTLEQLNQMIAPLVEGTVELCRQAVKNAGISEADVSAVLMAGGSSRVPLVRDMASRIAPDASLLCAVDLELAVAQGALEYRLFTASKPGTAAGRGQNGEHPGAAAACGGLADAEAWFRKGKEAEEQEEEEEAAEWYLRAAEAGHVEAMYEIGQCYWGGSGVPEDEKKAAKWYRKAAKAGHVEAMHEIGRCHQYGWGVPEDKEKGVKWYRRAIEAGSAEAMISLGECYNYGYGVDEDGKQAYYWYNKAVEAGYDGATFHLGLCYQYGTGVEIDYRLAAQWYRKYVEATDSYAAAYCLGEIYEQGGYGITADREEAIRWYQKALELGADKAAGRLKKLQGEGLEGLDAEEVFQMGREADEDGDEKRACYLYRKAAKAGCSEAFYYVGSCCRYGSGTNVDYKQAVHWYCKSVEAEDNCVSAYNLGKIYEQGGHGITADRKEAVRWYQKAIELGYDEVPEAILDYSDTAAARLEELQGDEAIECAGRGYEAGQRGDYREAVRWYLKAADKGSAPAMYNLGIYYHNGTGVIQNYVQAFQWFCKAANAEHVWAMYMVGLYYYNGHGMAQDYNRAVYWYRKAADKGDEDAMCQLGACYEFGQGVSQDYVQAVGWYHKAASKGQRSAMFKLGACYDNGRGVNQNYTQANQWYRKAADKGHADAMNNLGVNYQNGWGVPKDLRQAAAWFRKAAELGNELAGKNLRKMGL